MRDRNHIWTNSLYLYPDKVVVRTYDHNNGYWWDELKREIKPPILEKKRIVLLRRSWKLWDLEERDRINLLRYSCKIAGLNFTCESVFIEALPKARLVVKAIPRGQSGTTFFIDCEFGCRIVWLLSLSRFLGFTKFLSEDHICFSAHSFMGTSLTRWLQFRV